MSDGLELARAPRAVADVPPPALADGEAVAKAWLLALLAAAPLAAAADVPVAELAAGGPPLCAALLEAVGSEAALDRLRPGGDRAALAAGAGALAGTRDPAGAAAAVAALRRALTRGLAGELRDLDAPTTAALADRVAHVADVVTAAVLAPVIGADLAGAEEPWRAAIDRRLAAGGAPFAVLAVEADDADRLTAAGRADAAALDALEPAVRAAAGADAEVVRERPGRLWVLAPAAGADALAGRIAAAAGAAAAPHGTPLTAAVGVARWPDDGPDAAALAAHADERLFAARAAGVPVL